MKLLRFFVLVIHGVVLLMLLSTLLNQWITPSFLPWINILSLAFPYFMGVNILLCLFWIFQLKKRSILFLGLSVFLIGPTQRWFNYHSKSLEEGDIKVLTINTKLGKMGVKSISDFLQIERPDIVFLQEYGSANNYQLGKDYHQGNKNGLTRIFSKYPILSEQVIFKSTDGVGMGNANYADLNVNGKLIRVFNIYLQPFKFKKDSLDFRNEELYKEKAVKGTLAKLFQTFVIHQQQIELIKQSIENSPYPVIVGGDFNAVPNSYEYYQISRNLVDPFVEVGKGFSTTFHDFKIPIRIDYIFASQEFVPVFYKVDRSEKLSDHFPVIVKYRIKNDK